MRELKITHLYPELLNLYGDKGNIASLKCRAEWRGISASVTEVKRDDELNLEDTDILFLGGGSEKELETVLNLLLAQKEKIISYAENGGVLLSVCEGMTLLGNSLEIFGKQTNGLGILDIKTTSSNKRKTGDVAGECDIDGEKFIITGFENRAFDVDCSKEMPFLKVICGNGETDGALKNNVFASCLHGPLLPKNPKLCDILLKRALEKKYGEVGEFPSLDDGMENEASSVMQKRLISE